MQASKFISLVSVLVFLGACAHFHTHEHVARNEIIDLGTWGKGTQVKQLRHLYFASQPDITALESFKAKGGQVVINLRSEKEKSKYVFEEDTVEALSMRYYHLPVNGKKLDKAVFKGISDTLQAHAGEKVLIHCSSGNRASAWLVHHIVQDHQQDFASALDIAEATLLTKAGLKKQLSAMYQ